MANMSTLYDSHVLVGFLLARGKSGTEAFTPDEVSLGLFPSAQAASDALWTHHKRAHEPKDDLSRDAA